MLGIRQGGPCFLRQRNQPLKWIVKTHEAPHFNRFALKNKKRNESYLQRLCQPDSERKYFFYH